MSESLDKVTSSSAKILIVEDEPGVRVGLEDNLQYEGYRVIARENGLDGLEAFKIERPDLVILDVVVPGIDGLELCRQIRSIESSTPIIMLTAKGAEIDKVVGLELGADDYLTKPFAMRELFARIKAVLRRAKSNGATQPSAEQQPVEELKVGEAVVDFRAYRAWRGSDEIQLSAKEFDLLKFLSKQPGIPVTRDQLLDQVWGYNSYPTTRTVDNFIARLRQKLEETPDKPRFILTVHGVGYKFVVEGE